MQDNGRDRLPNGDLANGLRLRAIELLNSWLSDDEGTDDPDERRGFESLMDDLDGNASSSLREEDTMERTLPHIGDFVEIIANSNAHDFEIGQIVQVVEWQDFDPEDAVVGVECAPVNGGEHWFVRHTDYRITTHPSEYERLRELNVVLLKTLRGMMENCPVCNGDGYASYPTSTTETGECPHCGNARRLLGSLSLPRGEVTGEGGSLAGESHV